MRIVVVLMLITSSLFAEDNHSPVAKQYMSSFKEIAIAEMYRSKIPASIKLAQGMLESNWGRSELATVANNHFGIKCGGSWDGEGFYKEDDDRNDKGELIESCFRKFANATESYMAHSDFLTDERKNYRYGFLFDLETTDYKGWAKGLKKAGYATDPAYPKKLISIIEQYNLDEYDVELNNTKKFMTSSTGPVISDITFPHERPIKRKEKSATKTKAKRSSTEIAKTKLKKDSRVSTKHISRLAYSLESTNDVRMVIAMGGETIEQLSRKVGVALEDILVYNEAYIQKEEVLNAGDKIYLERKKRKLAVGPTHHKVQEGETMESIAQLYGLRLKSLYAKNRMPSYSKTIVGQSLFLKETASLGERPKFIKVVIEKNEDFLFEDDPTVK